MTSSELKHIILYDIACNTPGHPWSPNTMKTRYCLGYKQLPFTTAWAELPDIAGLLQSKGLTNPPYTLPVIEDPNTGTIIKDSLAIATYLDETYPETPKVLTPAVRAVLEKFGDAFSFGSGDSVRHNLDIAPRLVFLVLGAERLNPVSKEYYYQTRSARLGERWTMLADACSNPDGRAERVRQGIEAIRGTWHKVTGLYQDQADEGTSGGPFAFGKEPCFFDFTVAGRVKFVLGALKPAEAEVVRNLEGGRLGRLVEDLERYYNY